MSSVEYYEALRRGYIDGEGSGRPLRGLALLMQRGMACWMRAIDDDAITASRASSAPRGIASPILPQSTEQQLISILATMVLKSATEVCT